MTELSNEILNIVTGTEELYTRFAVSTAKVLNELLNKHGHQLDFRIGGDGELCGDFIERLRGELDTFRGQLCTRETRILATVEGFAHYPAQFLDIDGEKIDVGAWCREAYIDGFLANK